ncbi:MAG: rod shape-determining protein MreC [Phycisphaerae bacterium]|nr:rod shape-determining protein MreC [Phycisphaerae bacterium]
MRPIRLTRGRAFTLLLLAAAVLAVLPPTWTRWLRSPFQILALPQWAVLRPAQRALDGAVEARQAEHLARLERENEQLRMALGQERLWREDLERRYDAVCGLRGQMWSDNVHLVVAPVLGFDVSPWRETALIGRGADSNLAVGQWVAAGEGFEGWESGAEFLLQRCIVGRIVEVETHVSRVELTTDPKFREKVVPVKVLADGTMQPEQRPYVVTGAGRRSMVIRQADADLSKLGFTYLALPARPGLPATLSLGRIKSSQQSAQSALHYDIEAEPLVNVARLRYVAVIAAKAE